MTFRNRPLRNETDLCPHQQDLDPDAKYFQSVDGAATERGWQLLRLNQSRGMIVLVKYPN